MYRSHDDGEEHGYVMADGFTDLLERWIPPGCPDGEDWQRLPCTNGKATLIDPNCHNALTGKSLFGGE